MSEDFKYLGNNPGTKNVPFLDNVNVQKTVTNFNYSVWGDKTKLYLKHVPASWDSDYENVVEFKDKAERDKYFKTNDPIVLETEFRIGHDGSVRLPIPYDNIIDYNYLVAEYPDAPIPGYNPKIARKQYFYFIKDCLYIAPNTTEVILELDIWTTYLDDIEVGNMQLERGHYAMTLTNVETFLSNPLKNNMGLLTPDINFDEASKISSSEFIQYSGETSEMYMGIVTTANIVGDWSDNVPTANVSNIWAESSNDANILNIFFLEALKFPSFCSQVQESLPQFYQTVVAVFKINKKFLGLERAGNTFKLPGIDVPLYGDPQWPLSGLVNMIDSIYLNKKLFNFPKEYEDITKLYTSPYSKIEITQTSTKENKEIDVQSIGGSSLDIYKQVSLSYPFLGIRAFAENINTENKDSYNWLGNIKSDWENYCFDDEFPQYSMIQNGNKKYLFESKYPRIQQQNDINLAYSNGSKSANTGKINADASASTGKTNSTDSASTGKANSDAGASASNNISKRNNDQASDFATHDLNTDAAVLDNNIDQNKRMSYANMLSQQQTAWNNLNNENTAYAAKGAGTVTACVNTAVSGAMGGAGNPMAVASVAAGTVNQSYNFLVADTMFDITSDMIKANLTNALNIQKEIGGLHQNHIFNVKSVDKSFNVSLNQSEGLINTTARENFSDKRINTEYKRDQSFNNAEQNRNETYNTSIANNQRSYNTSINNTNRSYNTSIANNQRSYDTTISNLTSVKNNSETAIENTVKQSKLNNNVAYGQFTNDIIDKQNARGLVIKFKKQPDDAIKRTGDYFLRYGYAYDGNCNFSEFNLMKYFTYWKADEVWLTADKVNNKIINKFKEILKNGVTVWRNPADIGNISIYDNKVGGE